MLEKFKNWLADNRPRGGWFRWNKFGIPGLNLLFSKDSPDSQEKQEPKKLLVELPPEIYQKLVNVVENLPSNGADQQAIISSLDERFDRWRDAPSHANNSVLILSSPVAAVSSVLSEALEEWAEQKQVSIRLLPLTARPTEIATIKSKLEHYLESLSPTNNSTQQKPEVVVIPNLSWCFLRSLEGLAGIEYLQSLLCKNPHNRFWIVGTNQVGWEYLNLVSNLQAYFGEIVRLPNIESKELQAWLAPIIDEFDITFDKPNIDKQLFDQDKDNQDHYFDRLNKVSNGVSTVAAQLFLQSISYQDEDEKEEEEEKQTQEQKLVAQTPKLPPSHSLDSEAQYLLYNLLLHGDLTLSALAESLGDEESKVQVLVQMLRRQGIVKQQDQVLTINPIYYPTLKQQLASNNFIIDSH